MDLHGIPQFIPGFALISINWRPNPAMSPSMVLSVQISLLGGREAHWPIPCGACHGKMKNDM